VIECDTRFRTGQEGFADNYTPNRDMPPSDSSSEEEEEDDNVDLDVKNLSLKTTNE
jgi:hypothetical protein